MNEIEFIIIPCFKMLSFLVFYYRTQYQLTSWMTAEFAYFSDNRIHLHHGLVLRISKNVVFLNTLENSRILVMQNM